jgi:hypothetical protein
MLGDVPRPRPTPVLHFTRVEHLATVAENGLLSDNLARARGLLTIEIGEPGIKGPRRRRQVAAGPGGVVADYAPLYYAPRSPMMFSIHMGNVPTYQEGCDDVVYLATTIELLLEHDLDLVFTDRNAVLAIARMSDNLDDLDDLVDWPLMRQRMWNNTPQEPDRMERRMAECLVHEGIPWQCFFEVVANTRSCAQTVEGILGNLDHQPKLSVRSGWYF